MATDRSLCLAVLLTLAAAPVEDVESLSNKYVNRVNVAFSKAGSDAARERARKGVADDYRAKAEGPRWLRRCTDEFHQGRNNLPAFGDS
jgi:hypothetical protein